MCSLLCEVSWVVSCRHYIQNPVCEPRIECSGSHSHALACLKRIRSSGGSTLSVHVAGAWQRPRADPSSLCSLEMWSRGKGGLSWSLGTGPGVGMKWEPAEYVLSQRRIAWLFRCLLTCPGYWSVSAPLTPLPLPVSPTAHLQSSLSCSGNSFPNLGYQ